LFCATRLNSTDCATQTLAGRAHFILQLQIHPEFLGHAKETSQPDSGIRGDASSLQHNVVDARSRHANGSSKLVGRHSHWFQEFFAKNLAGMNFPNRDCIFLSGHRVFLRNTRSMVIRDFDLERVAVFPHEANPELIINSYAGLPFTVGLQSLEAVPRGNAKVIQSSRRIQQKKLSQGCANQARRKLSGLSGQPQ